MACLKSVKKWQENLKGKLNILEIVDGKVNHIKCVVCYNLEDRIKDIRVSVNHGLMVQY